MNNFFFIWLPYIAILIAIAGAIKRYKSQGFSDSFTSSEINIPNGFKNGVPLFYVGIGLLLFGHLLGFLFPAGVLAWNGQRLRLMIIETGAFGFALASFFSIFIFIYRRLKAEKIINLLTKIDLLIYALLLTLIISGLWVANFYRWGSSWYASVITPYLHSLIKFSPDISAISYMPLAVKIHIVSAFAIVGVITFTRFDNYLVYPLRYIMIKFRLDFKTVIIIATVIIVSSIALIFGNQYEIKKAANKLPLLTKDNKVVQFEDEK